MRQIVGAFVLLFFLSYAMGAIPFLYKHLGQCQQSESYVVSFSSSHCGMKKQLQVFRIESDGSMKTVCHQSKKQTDEQTDHSETASPCLLCSLATTQKQLELPGISLSNTLLICLEDHKKVTLTPHIGPYPSATSERGPPLA